MTRTQRAIERAFKAELKSLGITPNYRTMHDAQVVGEYFHVVGEGMGRYGHDVQAVATPEDAAKFAGLCARYWGTGDPSTLTVYRHHKSSRIGCQYLIECGVYPTR